MAIGPRPLPPRHAGRAVTAIIALVLAGQAGWAPATPARDLLQADGRHDAAGGHAPFVANRAAAPVIAAAPGPNARLASADTAPSQTPDVDPAAADARRPRAVDPVGRGREARRRQDRLHGRWSRHGRLQAAGRGHVARRRQGAHRPACRPTRRRGPPQAGRHSGQAGHGSAEAERREARDRHSARPGRSADDRARDADHGSRRGSDRRARRGRGPGRGDQRRLGHDRRGRLHGSTDAPSAPAGCARRSSGSCRTGR